MSYYLAPSLVKLRDQINTRWPRRGKASDGWIGDTAHSARVSDHNPDYNDGGVVRALDVDKDGIDVDALLKAVLADARVSYVIWNRRIWQKGTGWKPYYGTNGHTAHVHISLKHTKAAESGSAWALPAKAGIIATVAAAIKKATKPTVKPAASTSGKAWPSVALPSTSAHTAASHAAWVKLMADIGYKDADLGKALQRWLSKLGYYTGAIDGNFLRVSTKALQKFLKAKGHYKGVVDGSRGGVTIKAEIAYLNSQRKHY